MMTIFINYLRSNALYSIFVFKVYFSEPKADAFSNVKLDVKQWGAKQLGLRLYIAKYTVANFRCYPIRRRATFVSSLESGFCRSDLKSP